MSPFYRRLPHVQTLGLDTTAQQIGIITIAGVAALTAVHGVGVIARMQRNKRKAKVAPDGTVVMEPPAGPDEGAGTPGGAATGGPN